MDESVMVNKLYSQVAIEEKAYPIEKRFYFSLTVYCV